MIIVLDGPDGVGKTTLAHKMCERFQAKYLHLTYRWKDRIFDYHTAAIRYAARQNKPIVIDRWWPSEAVYAKNYRQRSEWPLQGRLCDRIAKKFGVIYVYCLPESVESAVQNHAKLRDKREEMYDDISGVAELYLKLWHGESTHLDDGQYIDQLIRTGGIKDFPDVIDYSIAKWGNSMDLFIERVYELSKSWREQQYSPVLEYSNWGITGHAAHSKYIIVGDDFSKQYREMRWPFYYLTGYDWWTQETHNLNLSESLFMYADARSDKLLDGLVERYPDKKIITVDIAANYKKQAWFKNCYADIQDSYTRKPDLVEVFKHEIN